MSKTYTILHTNGETRHGKDLLTELLLVPRDSQFTQGSYIVLEEDNAGAWAAAKAATLAIAAGNMSEMTVSLAAEEACE